jgi:uncharacterized protein (DUF2141 family)
MLNRFGRRLGAALIIVGVLPGAAPTAEVAVTVEGLRSHRGTIIACLVSNHSRFPDCREDPTARHVTVSADRPALRFTDLPSGQYAVSLIHDENGNARLDRFGGIPREGVGFSRNPRLTFGPPDFTAAEFSVSTSAVKERVRVKYFL